MHNVTLAWVGPFKLHQIVQRQNLSAEFDDHGVYVWLNNLQHRISYVGKADTTTLWKRQYDWYWSGISGQSMIPGDMPKNYSWIPNRYEIADIITDEDRYIELVRRAFRYMHNFDVYVAATQGKAVIKKIEQLLLFSLHPDDTKCPASEPECEFTLSHQKEPWAAGLFAGQVRPLSNRIIEPAR